MTTRTIRSYDDDRRWSALARLTAGIKAVGGDIVKALEDAGASDHLLTVFAAEVDETCELIEWDVFGCRYEDVAAMVDDEQALRRAAAQYITQYMDFDIEDGEVDLSADDIEQYRRAIVKV